MKELIIGIDGATEWIFDLFEMPFWSELKKRSHMLQLKEDILQRGWVRMLSGQRASQNAGFYTRPKLDGSRNFTMNFGFNELRKLDDFVPIWQFAERTGKKVGLMNIPTTFPSQQVNGFHVAGGGGGIYSGGMPDGSIFPLSIADNLKKHNYIFDVRLGQQSFSSPNALCAHINEMTSRRTTSFVELAQQFGIDFGFIAYRGPTVLMYLAMSEIMAIHDPEERKRWVRKESSGGNRSNWPVLLREHFKTMDDSLRSLFQELGPENYMVVSDHSMVPWRFKGDLNFFAEQNSYLIREGIPLNTAKNVAKYFAKPKYRKALSSLTMQQKLACIVNSGAKISQRARVFGSTYINGLFVNDNRFNGCVGEVELNDLVDEFVGVFNEDPTSVHYGLKAVPYRRNFLADLHSDSAPDIKIEHSGEFFFTERAGCFIRDNEDYGEVESLAGVSGMHSGQKGDKPVLLVNAALAQLVREDDVMDLSLVHMLTRRLYN